MSPLLEIKDLKVTFETENGPFHAVDDVSFSIASNETVCIVGESGSGKSITSLSVMGLLPDNGTVTNGSLNFQGKSLLEKTEEEMQKLRGNDISMIFQEPMTALNPVLKIGYQLSEPLFIHKKVSKKEVRKKSIELLDKVGIPEPAEKLNMFPHELSGGMRQRVMIAMALAGEPSLLIADEPTTALDVTIQAQILELLEDLKKQFNMGVLFVTHDMGVVAEIADRVIVMNNGKVVESGTVDAIFNRPVHPYTKKLLGAVPDVDQPKEGPARLYNDQSDVLLEAKNLSKYYPVKTSLFQKKKEPVKAVKNISFEIFKGETLGVVGESGSGKSTLGRTIIGLEDKTNGTLQFNGKDLGQLPKQEVEKLRKEMQMIFQDPFASLDPRQKIGRAIEEVFVIHTNLTKEERKKKVLSLLYEVGLNESHYDRYPHEFSGGQRQRIGIARAVALNPSLIVCDEAVSALDVSIQAQVIELLKKLQKEYDLTYLFISHDLGVVRQICDRIMVMYFGSLVEIGTAEQIFNNPQHPYTKMLLSAVPRPKPGYQKELISKESFETNVTLQPKDWLEVNEGHLVAVY